MYSIKEEEIYSNFESEKFQIIISLSQSSAFTLIRFPTLLFFNQRLKGKKQQPKTSQNLSGEKQTWVHACGNLLLLELITHCVQQRHNAIIIRTQQGYSMCTCVSVCLKNWVLGRWGFELIRRGGTYFPCGTPAASLGTISISSILVGRAVRNLICRLGLKKAGLWVVNMIN